MGWPRVGPAEQLPRHDRESSAREVAHAYSKDHKHAGAVLTGLHRRTDGRHRRHHVTSGTRHTAQPKAGSRGNFAAAERCASGGGALGGQPTRKLQTWCAGQPSAKLRRYLMLVNSLHIRIIHTTTGRIFRELTLNPAVDYQAWGVSPSPGQSRLRVLSVA